jgi:hypothetical protein
MTLAQACQALDLAIARLQVARIRASDDDERAGIDAQLAKLAAAKLALNLSAQRGRPFDSVDLETATAADTIAKLRKAAGGAR